MSDASARQADPTGLAHPLTPEDRARADLYALLARLYAAGPDQTLLEAIAHAPAMGLPMLVETPESKAGLFGAAWDTLRAASSVMDHEAAAAEYVDLFIGVGKSEVNLHASHWLTGFMMEKPLAEVRATLAILGLGRKDGVTMVEDHLSALLETMRLLIAGHDERGPAPLSIQQQFFEEHISPWVDKCCAAISCHPIANYYKRVAEFTESYVALERDSFAIG